MSASGQPGEERAEPLSLSQVGLVLIGRNEGDRLRQSLESIPDAGLAVVYVDSGSTDGSVELARQRGVTVVELDLSIPFTAARARNAGFARLRELRPELRAVQFIDGDCALVPGWLEAAVSALGGDPRRAAVCGWRRERFPEATIFNRLCDLEWKAPPVGDVGEFGFGGDVLIRVEPFLEAGGYEESLIAGEDPELSSRLRFAGYAVLRIDRDMTRHDADMHSLGQWWMRSKRAGHASAEVALRHRARRLFARHLRSVLIWGVVLPVLALLAPLLLGSVGLALSAAILLLYGLQVVRIARSMEPARYSRREGLLWGVSCLVSQVPKAIGVLTFVGSRLRGERQRLIEYK